MKGDIIETMKRLMTILHILVNYFTIFILLPYIFLQFGKAFTEFLRMKVLFQSIGVSFVLIGIINSLYSYKLFFTKGHGTPIQTEPSQKIVVDGLYKYTRNPIYLGHFLMIFGEFLLFGYFSLLIYLILFMLYTNLVIVFIEEKGLEKRFGNEYLMYKNSVPRYLFKF